MHCHTEKHLAAGMSLILQEGDASQMPLPPDGMPTCGDFLWDGQTKPIATQAKKQG